MAEAFAEALRSFSLAFPGTREEFAFGPGHAVYKAANGKLFAIVSGDEAATYVTLKLTPDEAEEALTLPFVSPAPYLGRHHWVRTTISDDAELEMTYQWVRRSHELVTAKSARKKRQ